VRARDETLDGLLTSSSRRGRLDRDLLLLLAFRKEKCPMLSDNSAIATIAVKNLEAAKRFYEGTLGLKKVGENEEVLTFKTRQSTLFVYRSQSAGTNKATAATFVAEDVDGLVKTLKGKGVAFEHYDLPELTRQGDVHVAGAMKAAWF